MCHSWRERTQGHRVLTTNDTYNDLIQGCIQFNKKGHYKHEGIGRAVISLSFAEAVLPEAATESAVIWLFSSRLNAVLI